MSTEVHELCTPPPRPIPSVHMLHPFVYFPSTGNNDVILLAPPLRFLADDPVFTNISFILSQDGIAQELDETFSITFEGLDVQNDLVFGADVTDVLNVTIVDADGMFNCMFLIISVQILFGWQTPMQTQRNSQYHGYAVMQEDDR